MAVSHGTLELKEHAGKQIWLLTDVPAHVRIRLKDVFQRVPKYQMDSFLFPADARNAADLHWFAERYPFAIKNGYRKRLDRDKLRYDAHRAELEEVFTGKLGSHEFKGLQPGEEVRPYQKIPVELLMRTGGLLLADKVGLGKTYSTIAAALQEPARPAVVVVEPHLSKQWWEKITEFSTLSYHEVTSTRPYNAPYADILIFRYTQIAGWLDVLSELKIGLVAFDEIQSLRHGTDTKKGQAAAILSNIAKFRLGLSATPIYNWGSEMWNIMQYINPEVLGSKEDFTREWMVGKQIADPKALGSFLQQEKVYLRRSKGDVGQDMPEAQEIPVPIEHDHTELASIEAVAKRLAKIATTGEFTERGQAARELDVRVRKATGIAKAAFVAQFVRMIVEGGETVLLAGWHRDVYDIWNKELADLKPVMYTGSESPRQKAQAKEAIISGKAKLLMMSLRSGAGMDGLQHVCSTVVIGELDWSKGVHDQIIGRVDREGQTEPVTAYFPTINDGSDPPMIELIGLKASETSQVMDPHLGIQKKTTDRTRLMALAERYL